MRDDEINQKVRQKFDPMNVLKSYVWESLIFVMEKITVEDDS